MAGKVQFVPTVDDHVAGQRLWVVSAWRRPVMRVMAIMALVLLALGVVTVVLAVADQRKSVMQAMDDVWPLLMSAPVLALLLGYRRVMIPRSVRRMCLEQPSLLAETTWQWDDEGVVVASAAGSSVIRWVELHRWIEDRRSVVLLPQARLLLILPRRVLLPEIATDLDNTLARFAGRARTA